jgi:hypothetical protein
MDGKIVGDDGKFTIENEIIDEEGNVTIETETTDRPLGEGLSASNAINCRCQLFPVEE